MVRVRSVVWNSRSSACDLLADRDAGDASRSAAASETLPVSHHGAEVGQALGCCKPAGDGFF